MINNTHHPPLCAHRCRLINTRALEKELSRELLEKKKLYPLVNKDFKTETCEDVQNLKADLIFGRKYIYYQNVGPQKTFSDGRIK